MVMSELKCQENKIINALGRYKNGREEAKVALSNLKKSLENIDVSIAEQPRIKKLIADTEFRMRMMDAMLQSIDNRK